jgi:UDP-N-acetylglucosamine 3-dehydrogenase
MGSHHLRVLRSMLGVEVTGVVDPDERRRELASTSPGCRSYQTVDDALADGAPDFACLAAPAHVLPELAAQFIAADVPLLVEKPLADTESRARTVVEMAGRRGVLLGVGHVERFNPAVIALRERLAQGGLGVIYQIHARRLSPFPNRESLLGVALDMATHDIDVVRYLTGSEVDRVYSEVARRAPDDRLAREGTEDLICASLRMADGATGLLEVNWLTPRKVRELTVTGENGTYVVDYLTQDLYYFENPRANIDWDALNVLRGTGEGDMIRFAIERHEPLRAQWDEFLRAVRDGTEPPVSGWDGLAALSIGQAVQRSGREHRPVRPGYRNHPQAAPANRD